MENYEIIKKTIKLKKLKINFLEEYYEKIIKIKKNIEDINYLNNKINKKKFFLNLNKDLSKEENLNNLRDFYLENNYEKIKNYNFSKLINDFENNWKNNSKLLISQQNISFYKKIAKYKAYIKHNSNDQNYIRSEFSDYYNYFKDLNQKIKNLEKTYEENELKKFNEFINLIMLKKNDLLENKNDILKLKFYLNKTHNSKFKNRYGCEVEINWIKKPICYFTEEWDVKKIKDFFEQKGIKKLQENEKFYYDIKNNKTLIKEQIILELAKIFQSEIKGVKNLELHFQSLILETNEKFKIIFDIINEDNIYFEDLNNLLVNEIFLLNNSNLSIHKNLLKMNKKNKTQLLKLKSKIKNKKNENEIIKNIYKNKIQEFENKINQKQKNIQNETRDLEIIENETKEEFKNINNYLNNIDEYIKNFNFKNIEIIEIKDNIKFNKKIIKNINNIVNISNIIEQFEENNFFKIVEYWKEIPNKLKNINEHLSKILINYEINNENNENSLPPPNHNIEKDKKDFELIFQLEKLEIEQKNLKNEYEKMKEQLNINPNIKIEKNEEKKVINFQEYEKNQSKKINEPSTSKSQSSISKSIQM